MTSAYLDPPSNEFTHHDAITAPAAAAFPEVPARVDAAIELEEAVLYLRVSSKKQMDTDSDYDPEGNSIPTQRRVAQAKADALGARVWREYVEPGRSATSLEKRVAFQEMMADLKTENRRRKKDGQPIIRYVIVYMMSRAFRNALEELQTKAQLAKMGITLVSAKENFGDGYLGDAMQGILAIFNELQSRMSGDDIRTKMANKARNGGTIARAPIGYLNTTKLVEGRHVRTVIIDPERGALVRLAFELYATGEYSLIDLSEEMYDRGLLTRPTARNPAQAISDSQLVNMLRDRYYIGVVTFKDEEIEGRHEPLLDEDLFERVQEVLEMRSTADERRRIHHHYLKGSLFCDRCKGRGMKRRMVLQNTTKRNEVTYQYFFCTGKHHHNCTLPYVNTIHLEELIEDYYATIQFAPDFVAEVRDHLTNAIDEEKTASRLLRQQLTSELKNLDSKEENLLDLAADGDLPKDKIKAKLRDIERRRRHLTERLQQTNTDLAGAARVLDLALTLLEDPQGLYLRSNDHQRRLLNQAIFRALYVEEDTVTGELTEPFASLHALQATHSALASRATPLRDYAPTHDNSNPQADEDAAGPYNANRTLAPMGEGPVMINTLQVLLGGTGSVPSSNSPNMVGDTGFEPVASSV